MDILSCFPAKPVLSDAGGGVDGAGSQIVRRSWTPVFAGERVAS